MSEHNVLERNGEVFHGVEGPRSVSDPREPGVEFDQQDVTARAGFPTKSRLPKRLPQPIRQKQFGRRRPTESTGPVSCVAAPLSP